MAETTMRTPAGALTLRRPHSDPSSPLRAWSAADALVLDHLATNRPGRLLIVNDEFGALTCALADHEPTVWTDSALSRAATDANLRANGLRPLPAERSVRGDERPTGEFDTIVVRVPKSSALLGNQLSVLTCSSDSGTAIVGAGMVRHIHSSTVAAFETLGPTTTSRATRKARLIFCTPTASGAAETPAGTPTRESDCETTCEVGFVTPEGVEVMESPGTFSAGHLDVGTALLLEVLSERAEQAAPQPGSVVVDLGSGNGVLIASLMHRWRGRDLQMIAVDASDLAVAATRATWEHNAFGVPLRAIAADGLAPLEDASVDLVVTNPPFHQGHAVDADLTDHLLADTARVLRPNGVAYVVVQRHLDGHVRMRRWFDTVDVASKHPSHVVLIARR